MPRETKRHSVLNNIRLHSPRNPGEAFQLSWHHGITARKLIVSYFLLVLTADPPFADLPMMLTVDLQLADYPMMLTAYLQLADQPMLLTAYLQLAD